MIWKAEPEPIELQTKIIRKFAWWPTFIESDNVHVWLGHYFEKRQYQTHAYTGNLGEVGTRFENEPVVFGSLQYGGGWFFEGRSLDYETLIKPIDNFYSK